MRRRRFIQGLASILAFRIQGLSLVTDAVTPVLPKIESVLPENFRLAYRRAGKSMLMDQLTFNWIKQALITGEGKMLISSAIGGDTMLYDRASQESWCDDYLVAQREQITVRELRRRGYREQ